MRSIYVKPESKFELPDYIKGDLEWWNTYLPLYNGVSMMLVDNWSEPDELLATDSCLQGCGGVSGSEFFHASFPRSIIDLNLHINALELLTIVVALKIWGGNFRGRRIVVLCDNMSSCLALNKGSTRCSFMQGCLRDICFLSAIFEFEIRAQHISGINNRLPDLLSRWDLHPSYKAEFFKLFQGTEMFVADELFKVNNHW